MSSKAKNDGTLRAITNSISVSTLFRFLYGGGGNRRLGIMLLFAFYGTLFEKTKQNRTHYRHSGQLLVSFWSSKDEMRQDLYRK